MELRLSAAFLLCPAIELHFRWLGAYYFGMNYCTDKASQIGPFLEGIIHSHHLIAVPSPGGQGPILQFSSPGPRPPVAWTFSPCPSPRPHCSGETLQCHWEGTGSSVSGPASSRQDLCGRALSGAGGMMVSTSSQKLGGHGTAA